METQVQTEDLVTQKTRELCEAIVQRPQFQNIRQQLEAFLGNATAQQQYESLSQKGQHLQHKQEQGLQLQPAEISAFEAERQAFVNNPVAKGFMDAQEAMHQIQEEVSHYVSKTFELGRVPSAADMASCGSGCGCGHNH